MKKLAVLLAVALLSVAFAKPHKKDSGADSDESKERKKGHKDHKVRSVYVNTFFSIC